MRRLAISLLGPFEVTLDGEPVTRFGADTARALLAYLAVHPRTAHRRETLAGLLWPDQPEAEARHNLAQALHRLRQAIGDRTANPPFLEITRQTIGLHPEGDPSTPSAGQGVWVDVTAFREALAACRGHRHRHAVRGETCEACARRLEEAASLYRGEFMAGFSLDSAPFEEWLVVEREELHRGALEALRDLAAYHEAQGEYEEAVAYGRRQIELEGWREGAHRGVMRALALSGDRAGALAQYEACQRVLAEELGVEPEGETTALYERIRDGEELQPQGALPPHNLPTYLTPFVGRKAYLAEIAQHLADPDCRLLTLVGPGGIGKTRLAVEAARGQIGQHEDGAFFVPLVAVPLTEGIVPAVARAIGFSFYGGADPKLQLFDYLRRRQVLLILDNYEHLLTPPRSAVPPAGGDRASTPEPSGAGTGGADLVIELLKAAPNVEIVVTTRAGLNVRGEHLLPIEGMHYPETLPEAASEVDWSTHSVSREHPERSVGWDAARYSAVQLFVTSARQMRPDFRPGMEDLRHVARICRLVEGMPLAIELAAAWVGMLTPAEIAAEIEQGIDILAADWRDAPAQQRSMRAVFDRSWRLLSAGEREVLCGLSVFRGGFTREAAQQVTGATLRDLRALVDRSLLHRAPEGRYEVHELLRRCAEEKLDRTPDAGETVRDRHSVYYAAALEEWNADLRGARQAAVLAEMDAETENARAACVWAARRGRIDQLERAMECLFQFYEWRVRAQEGMAVFRQAAEALAGYLNGPAGESPAARRVLARILAWQGNLNRRSGRVELSRRLVQQSTSLLDGLESAGQDVRLARATTLWAAGWLAWRADRQQARRLFEQSLALYRPLDDRWYVATLLRALGHMDGELGDYASAMRRLGESVAICRALDSPWETARSVLFLSAVHLRQGQAEPAERLAREALALYRDLGDRPGTALALELVANALVLAGRYAEIQPLVEASLSLYDDLVRGPDWPLIQWGKAKMHLGEYAQARAHAQRAFINSSKSGHRTAEAESLHVLSCIALADGACAEARRHLEENVALCQSLAMPDLMGMTYAVLGDVARRDGQMAQARHHLCRALGAARETGSSRPLMFAVPMAALLAADEGKPEQAIALYALASRHPFVANSRWFEDVAGKHIAAAAAALPPDAVAAAQERGRARDLWATVEELLAELASPETQQR